MVAVDIVSAFVEKCKSTLDLADDRHIDEYYYTSLPFCILDAVFSIGAHYKSTEMVVKQYSKIRGINRYTFEEPTDICTLQQFVDDVEKAESIETFAGNFLRNRQRTSTKNGILKADACYQIAKLMLLFGINTLEDFRSLSDSRLKELSDRILKITGQGSGIMLRYLFMLTGDDDTCKPDRHIRSYIEPIVGEDISDQEIQILFEQSIKELSISYPHLTIRRLDNLIWSYQRSL